MVFLGNKGTAAYLLTQLNFEADRLKDIFWLMPDSVGKDINIFERLDKGAANETVVFSKFSAEPLDVKKFVFQKWKNAMNNTASQKDHLETVMACTGRNTVPDWTNENVEPVVDAVYVFASALQRQQRFYCPGMQGNCHSFRKNFNLDSDLKNNPLLYNELATDVTVPEFAEVDREVRFSEDGELLPSTNLPVFEINMYLRQGNVYNFTKVCKRHSCK